MPHEVHTRLSFIQIQYKLNRNSYVIVDNVIQSKLPLFRVHTFQLEVFTWNWVSSYVQVLAVAALCLKFIPQRILFQVKET